jgi:hypothetical protein
MRYKLRPIAIGLIAYPAETTERGKRELRVQVGVRANAEGYALIESFELTGSPLRDGWTYDTFSELAERHDAHAVIVLGQVDRARVDAVAEQVRMVVVTVD